MEVHQVHSNYKNTNKQKHFLTFGFYFSGFEIGVFNISTAPQ